MNGSDCRLPRKDIPLHVGDTIIEPWCKGLPGSMNNLGLVALFVFRLLGLLCGGGNGWDL